jgi:threonine/homoserine/homoserine lactone efflux protein
LYLPHAPDNAEAALAGESSLPEARYASERAMVDPLPFAAYSFVMSITPGPNNVMLTASGATFGFRRTIPHMLGISFGCAVQLLAVCAGLGAVFSRWPDLQAALRWIGAAYLLYLGMQMLRSEPAGSRDSARPLTFLEGAFFQFLNPKAWIMTVTAATLFLPHELGVLAAGAYMLAIMVVMNMPCIAVWALFGSSLRRFLERPASRMGFNAAMAVALATTGVMMVM